MAFAARDAQIPDTQLAQGLVEAGKDNAYDLGSQPIAGATLRFQGIQHEEGVEREQIETAINGIGYGEDGMENRLASARHDEIIQSPGGRNGGLGAG
jgi:hypothetical protein